jgi:hypothetical protein
LSVNLAPQSTTANLIIQMLFEPIKFSRCLIFGLYVVPFKLWKVQLDFTIQIGVSHEKFGVVPQAGMLGVR